MIILSPFYTDLPDGRDDKTPSDSRVTSCIVPFRSVPCRRTTVARCLFHSVASGSLKLECPLDLFTYSFSCIPCGRRLRLQSQATLMGLATANERKLKLECPLGGSGQCYTIELSAGEPILKRVWSSPR